jgi:hypothetical protein
MFFNITKLDILSIGFLGDFRHTSIALIPQKQILSLRMAENHINLFILYIRTLFAGNNLETNGIHKKIS